MKMALKVALKPKERLVIGESVITNGPTRTQLLIEGKMPVLREKDIMQPAKARTPCEQLYLAVQTMYLATDGSDAYEIYIELVTDLKTVVPSLTPILDRIDKQLLTGSLYKALKETKCLIAKEEELTQNARGN